MKIACIAWGSLLWKPGALILSSGWHAGGPMLPLEFTRNSDDSAELAIVLTKGATLMPSFWALMATGDIEQACEQLRRREKISLDHPEWIGVALKSDLDGSRRGSGNTGNDGIRSWLAAQPFDAAIWTALPSKFAEVEHVAPSAAQAVEFLASLEGERRRLAEEYVRRIPAAINTAYRKQIERELLWTADPIF